MNAPVGWSCELIAPMPRRAFLARLAFAAGLSAAAMDRVWAALDGGFQLARLRCDACDWFTDFAGVGMAPSADVNFLERLAGNTSILARPQELSLAVDDAALFQQPFLVMHSHTPFVYSDAEVARLRTAVERGSFLFIEDCGGTERFDRAARDILRRMFPHRPLEPLPEGHALLHCLFSLRPDDLAGDKVVARGCECVILDGRVAVLYSRNDLHCAWEGHACRPGGEEQRDNAFRFGMNIVTYALLY